MSSLSNAKVLARQAVPFRVRDLLALTIWFGLVAGLLEAAGFLFLKTSGLLTWNMMVAAVDQNILWASPLMDLMVFLAAGIVLLVVFAVFRPARWMLAANVLFATLGWYALISLPGRLRERGAVMLALGLGVVLARVISRNEAAWMAHVRRSLVKLVVLAIVVGSAAASGDWMWEKYSLSRLPAAPAGAPNVLLLVLDTLRMDGLGAYGNPRGTSPFLDSYASKSVLFEGAFANSSWTLPSHVTFFTGKMPFEHSATSEPFDGRYMTIAQAMAGRGYSTVGIVANNEMATRSFGVGRGFLRYENIFTGPWDAAKRTLYGRKLRKFVVKRFFSRYEPRDLMEASEVNRRFLCWVDQDRDRPFFAFLNYMDTHQPNVPPEEFMQKFAKDRPRVNFETLSRQDPYDPEELRRMRGKYDAMVAYLDSELKKLFEEMEKRGLEKDLLVIIVSDHGESLGQHQLLSHRNSLYAEQLRVPLLIRMPGDTPDGLRISEPVSLHHLPATIMQMSGGVAGEFPGRSLAPCWSGGTCNEELILSEVSKAEDPEVDKRFPVRQGWVKSLVAGKWHFIVQQDGKKELYDWHNDPQESKNLAETAEGAEIVKTLAAKLKNWVPEAKQRAKREPGADGR